ncbi:MAG: hypothetical protein RLO11_11810, partial [Salinisphaeraceae bacterium]
MTTSGPCGVAASLRTLGALDAESDPPALAGVSASPRRRNKSNKGPDTVLTVSTDRLLTGPDQSA